MRLNSHLHLAIAIRTIQRRNNNPHLFIPQTLLPLVTRRLGKLHQLRPMAPRDICFLEAIAENMVGRDPVLDFCGGRAVGGVDGDAVVVVDVGKGSVV